MNESPVSSKPMEPEKMLRELKELSFLLQAAAVGINGRPIAATVTAGQVPSRAAALEQAIKALTILTDKRFAFVGGPESSFDGQCSMYEPGKPPVHGLADNPIEALLKAHEILYPPPTPSTDGKGGSQ